MSLGRIFRISPILEQENKLLEGFGISRMFETLDIPECTNFYNSDKHEIENRNISNHINYHFRQLELKKKMRSIAIVVSKKIGIYKKIRIFLNIFRKFLFTAKKLFNDS